MVFNQKNNYWQIVGPGGGVRHQASKVGQSPIICAVRFIGVRGADDTALKEGGKVSILSLTLYDQICWYGSHVL